MRDDQRHLCERGPALWIGVAVAWIVATVVVHLFLDSVVSRRLFEHPNHWHNNTWVDGFRQLGKAGVPIWLLAVWSCLSNKWRPTLVTMVAMILVGASVCPLKAIVRRPRPNDALTAAAPPASQGPDIPWQKKVSFPSGDTAVAFAAAAALSLSWGRLWAPILFATAGVIGLLRITAFAHYPSDVMAGAMIGVLCGIVGAWFITYWERRGSGPTWAFPGRERLIAALILIFVVPFISPYIGLRTLQIFLTVYAKPLAVMTAVCVVAVRLRARVLHSQGGGG